jgi:outer membrane immunogenic protein
MTTYSRLAAGVALAALMIAAPIATKVFAADIRSSTKDTPEYYESKEGLVKWSGLYAGVGVGYGWQDTVECGWAETHDAWLITGRVGYDIQRGRFVFGPFGDIEWLGLNDDRGHNFNAALGLRAGVLVESRLLAYVNGGIEFAGLDADEGDEAGFLGGGLEYALGGGWSLSGEGRVTFAAEEGSHWEVDDVYSVRALLNKKF